MRMIIKFNDCFCYIHRTALEAAEARFVRKRVGGYAIDFVLVNTNGRSQKLGASKFSKRECEA